MRKCLNRKKLLPVALFNIFEIIPEVIFLTFTDLVNIGLREMDSGF